MVSSQSLTTRANNIIAKFTEFSDGEPSDRGLLEVAITGIPKDLRPRASIARLVEQGFPEKFMVDNADKITAAAEADTITAAQVAVMRGESLSGLSRRETLYQAAMDGLGSQLRDVVDESITPAQRAFAQGHALDGFSWTRTVEMVRADATDPALLDAQSDAANVPRPEPKVAATKAADTKAAGTAAAEPATGTLGGVTPDASTGTNGKIPRLHSETRGTVGRA